MALKFKTRTAKSVSYGNKRSTSSIKFIVIHFTGNKGDSAKNNTDYFATGNTRAAGAHYFIDEGNIVWKSVPVNRVAWAVGGFVTNANGGAKFYKICTNANSLSIEMANSVGSIPKATYKNAVSLTKKLMKKYNIPASHVLRHNDVSGKQCPEPWCGKNNKQWAKFKADISGSTVVKPKASSKFKSYKVKVTASALKVRKSPSTTAAIARDAYNKGTTVTIKAVKNGWGKTKDGWIKLSYTKKC